MDEKGKRKVIVKKVHKAHHAAHGGSWKVAYADFVTAMMAFFLLMWLLAISTPQRKADLAFYFQNFSLFSRSGKSFMTTGAITPMPKAGPGELHDAEGSSKGVTPEEAMRGRTLEEVQQKLDELNAHLITQITESGTKVQIVDKKEAPIFLAGSPQLTETGRNVLKMVAVTMKDLPNEIVIEGHTDSSGVKSEQLTNWELSMLRACSARRELEANGIQSERISRLVGLANTVPLIQEDPADPRNRRISLVFLPQKRRKPITDPNEWLWKNTPDAR